MRLALRGAAILAGFLFCVPFHYLWKLLRIRSFWPQLFLAYAGRCCGLRVTVRGTPLGDNVLFAANHVSWLDILAIGGATRTAFVARDDVEGWPGVGWAANLNGTIYVVRHARREVREQADELRAALAAGRAVTLFPEGTTEAGHEVLPFRASLFASLYPALPGVRVQPIALEYCASGDAAWIGDEGYGVNAKRILSRPGTLPVTLHFLAPIDPREAGDRKALAHQAREEVVQALAASAGPTDPL